MMIDRCTDLQTKPRLWRGLREFQRCRTVMRHLLTGRDQKSAPRLTEKNRGAPK